MKLEQSLILNRSCHDLIGAPGLADLKPALYRAQQGPRDDGSS